MFDTDLFGNKSVQESCLTVASDVDHSRKGLLGQHLVSYDILSRGYPCTTCAEGLPYDLILHLGNRHISIQVKSRSRASDYGKSVASMNFGNGTDTCGKPRRLFDYIGKVDLLAFVFLDERLILYELPENQVTSGRNIRPGQFSPEKTERSWNYVAKALRFEGEEEELLKDWTWTPGI